MNVKMKSVRGILNLCIFVKIGLDLVYYSYIVHVSAIYPFAEHCCE